MPHRDARMAAFQDEQEVLASVADWFKARLEGLNALEYYQERRLKRLGLLDDDGKSTFEVWQ
jgi:hypothetical protein